MDKSKINACLTDSFQWLFRLDSSGEECFSNSRLNGLFLHRIFQALCLGTNSDLSLLSFPSVTDGS